MSDHKSRANLTHNSCTPGRATEIKGPKRKFSMLTDNLTVREVALQGGKAQFPSSLGLNYPLPESHMVRELTKIKQHQTAWKHGKQDRGSYLD